MTRDAAFWRDTLRRAAEPLPQTTLMEVCGSHSAAIARYGLRAVLPENVRLVSGPGCPVCVSHAGFIDHVRALAHRGVTLALFGDLLRIPDSKGISLRGESNLLVVYSPEEALDFARENPSREVVFAAVGFAPTLAVGAALLETAQHENTTNFSLLSDFKHLRPALDALAEDRETNIAGFLLPGHVGSIVGEKGYAHLPLPGVIAGFGAEDILRATQLLLETIGRGESVLLNPYAAWVAPGGNRTAAMLIDRFFEHTDSPWRGLGIIPRGGWRIRDAYAAFDAAKKYDLAFIPESATPCRCGDVLRGRIAPEACPLFGRSCTPEHPVGACMVSAEGACSAAWLFREVAV